MEEQVLVIPTAIAVKLGLKPGFSKDCEIFNGETFMDSLTFIDRKAAESDENYLQLIPYMLVSFPINDEPLYLVYQRGKSGSEERLHAKLSLGVGGHVNPIDGEPNAAETYFKALKREIDEELVIQGSFSIEPAVGILYDNSNDVGKVHVGLVHHVKLAKNTYVCPREDCLQNTIFLKKELIEKQLERFETWSQLVIKNLI